VEGWLAFATENSVLLIDAMALLVIVVGSVEAFFSCLRLMFLPAATNHDRRSIWLGFARWLVAGLTFQLAADIIESAIAPDWDDIGRLAAVAVIRTFLNFFLERDLAEARDLQHEPGTAET
jgi:uncharacterized membrane protein